MSNVIIMFLILIFIMIGASCLQIFLSKKQNKWLGLMLPIISFMYSLVTLLNVAVFDGMSVAEIAGVALSVFLLSNIPTVALLGIYIGCRKTIRKHSEINKMNIQDLD